MFRRRGCLFGCGSFLILGVGLALLVWFVVIPRITNALEDGVRDGLATVIAEEINPLYSPEELQQGQDVRFSFDDINRQLRESNQDAQFDGVELVGQGDQVVMRGAYNGQEMEIAFIPEIGQDGRLRLQPVDGGNWLEERVLDVLGGGLEAAINGWLERNGLILTDITLEPDGIVLSVLGE